VSEDLLVFEGVRWPRIHITETSPQPPQQAVFFDLAPVGNGRRYRARGPAGWWRDFLMDMNDREQVLRFLAKHGDPSGLLEKAALNAARERLGQPPADDPKPNTSNWRGLAGTLASITRAWDPPDGDGISRVDPARWNDAALVWRNVLNSVDDPIQWNDAEIVARDAPRITWLGRELELVSDPEARHPFIVRPRTLATFMLLSAAGSLYRRAKMRTCARCGSWFEFTKAHAAYCSVSCRAMAYDSRRA
jgi:hypothetical protein